MTEILNISSLQVTWFIISVVLPIVGAAIVYAGILLVSLKEIEYYIMGAIVILLGLFLIYFGLNYTFHWVMLS